MRRDGVNPDAYLTIPDADSGRTTWTNARSEATEFSWRPTALLWAWDLGAHVVLVGGPDDPAA